MTFYLDVRELLRETATPPTTLTTADLVQRGRRSVRRRRWATGGTSAAGVVLAVVGAIALFGPHSPGRSPAVVAATPSAIPSTPATPSTPPANDCAMQALPLPAGVAYASADAIDPTGHLIVGVSEGNRLVLWHDGAPSVLPPVATADDSGVQMGGVNPDGVVVGSTAASPGRWRAWVYRNGKVTALPAPPGHHEVIARSVNARGDIAGLATANGDDSVAVVWPAAAPGTVKVLTAGSSQYGASAFGIGDDGTVVGDVDDGGHPFVWDSSGHGRIIAETPGNPGGRAFATSGDWAVGWVRADTSSLLAAARWNLRTGALTTFGFTAPGTAVAADGTFLTGQDAPLSTVRVGPDGTTRQLANLSEPGIIEARGISADGRTLIGGINQSGRPTKPTVWHC